jgi:NAD(P)-dependent dehydrogenase (short-subunit alcohol dehydrogenase family)
VTGALHHLDGRVAIVTGAGRGLGRAYALALAARGAYVVVNNRSAEVAEEAVEEIRAKGGTAIVALADVTEPEECQGVVAEALSTYGRIDIVINNAGGIDELSAIGSFASISQDDRDTIMRHNFLSSWDFTAAAWPHLVAAGYGRVLMCSSPVSLFGAAAFAHYSAAKSAVVGLAKALAVEGAEHGITTNVISPSAYTRGADVIADEGFRSWFKSDFPTELVASAVAWLVDERSEVTGEIFSVGGPRIARVFTGETRGYVSEPSAFTPEAIGENFALAMDRDGLLAFASAEEAMAYLMDLYDAPEAARTPS